eukprot:CAMPEP_0116897868 /NCGR_PEP_ID=MMETSP0467-20121206/6727_1 /TAXON_ID=283647 /ORGANISM="Mesodinium pulex, Strain SPMC105" /LENGTH=177 /DNA_ID=CAMNT_0004569699 /DNA_START=1039 /DNA_END=1572 /DNA_ORIENTATION=-
MKTKMKTKITQEINALQISTPEIQILTDHSGINGKKEEEIKELIVDVNVNDNESNCNCTGMGMNDGLHGSIFDPNAHVREEEVREAESELNPSELQLDYSKLASLNESNLEQNRMQGQGQVQLDHKEQDPNPEHMETNEIDWDNTARDKSELGQAQQQEQALNNKQNKNKKKRNKKK